MIVLLAVDIYSEKKKLISFIVYNNIRIFPLPFQFFLERPNPIWVFTRFYCLIFIILPFGLIAMPFDNIGKLAKILTWFFYQRCFGPRSETGILKRQ